MGKSVAIIRELWLCTGASSFAIGSTHITLDYCVMGA